MEWQHIYDNSDGSSHCVTAQYNSLSSVNEANYHFLRNLWVPKDVFEHHVDDMGKCPRQSQPSIQPVHQYILAVNQYREGESERMTEGLPWTQPNQIHLRHLRVCSLVVKQVGRTEHILSSGVANHPLEMGLVVMLLEAWNCDHPNYCLDVNLKVVVSINWKFQICETAPWNNN